jgi:hypothetical protein
LLDPLTEAFTPKMASALLELRAGSELEAHIGELRQKANDGTLTPGEDAEYKDFVEAVDLISSMQQRRVGSSPGNLSRTEQGLRDVVRSGAEDHREIIRRVPSLLWASDTSVNSHHTAVKGSTWRSS